MQHVVSYLLQEVTSRRRATHAVVSGCSAPRNVIVPRPGRSEAPDLEKFEPVFSAPRLASVVGHHGPEMLERMRSRSIPWPEFSAREMADLIAFLNSP